MILNLTLTPASPALTAAGVINLSRAEKKELRQALNFIEVPTEKILVQTSRDIARIAVFNSSGCRSVLLDGKVPFLLPHLHSTLWTVGLRPLYIWRSRDATGKITQSLVGTEFAELVKHLQ